MIEKITDLTRLGHDRLADLLGSTRREAQGGLATRIMTELLSGPLKDAHAADAGPVEFDHFDLATPTGGQISSPVGTDIDLYATTSATNEAGVILIERGQLWSVTAGAGGWQGWGVVQVEYGITATPFQSVYSATPTSGYGARDVFAIDYTGHRHKPLHGRTLKSGGGITVHLKMRPLGPAGSTVIWPGADLLAISSAACTLIQKMQIFDPANYGPTHVRAMFQGGDGGAGEGRKALIKRIFGGGKIGGLLSGLGGLVGNTSSTIK